MNLSKALSWLLLPVWAAQVFTAQKSFHPNPLLGSLALNRRGLFVWRARLAHRMSHWRRRRLSHLVSEQDRQNFARDGYVLKSNFAPKDLFPALVAEIEGLAASAGEFKEGDAITRRIPLTPANLKRLPACRRLLALPQWRGLTRYVSSFDSEPLVFIQTIFTQVDDDRTDPQTSMHIDTFHPTMKAWLFLHDVEEADGPFTYVPGSHLRTRRREAWEKRMSIRASDPKTSKKGGSFRVNKANMARMRAAKPKRFPVRANTFVVADTYGFHARRPSLKPSMRIELWAYSRRNPFSPMVGFDLAGLPLIKGRAAQMGWWFMELRKKLGLPAPQFRRIAHVLPGEPPQPWTA